MSDKYYDISVTACGFLNRVHTVEPTDGQPYLVCTFAALRGAKGERAEPTYFDVKVVGEQARALLTLHQSFINDRSRKVFAAVRLSDLYVRSFVRERGERQGETGFSLKTRLLGIETLAIDGNVVYRRAEDPTAEARRTSQRPRTESPSGETVQPSAAVDALPPRVRRGRTAANARP
jgi:hypothetical protein